MYWEDAGPTRERWVPLHADYIRSKFKHSFEWQTTRTTMMSIAVTGSGSNYSGGLSYSRRNENGVGWYGTKGASQTNVNHQWKTRWVYDKQAQWCFNAGYMYKTGRTRWIADHWKGGVDTWTGQVERWTCDRDDYRARVGVNFWVSRATSRTWVGWFGIAGVKLDSKATFTVEDSGEKRVRATYILKNPNGHGFLCGLSADIVRSPFVEETDR